MPLTTMITPPEDTLSAQAFRQQFAQPWETTASYTQLDAAFHDLFDYGMPNVFRDPTTWEFLNAANEEASPIAGSDLTLPAQYASIEPECEYGYVGTVNSISGQGPS